MSMNDIKCVQPATAAYANFCTNGFDPMCIVSEPSMTSLNLALRYKDASVRESIAEIYTCIFMDGTLLCYWYFH